MKFTLPEIPVKVAFEVGQTYAATSMAEPDAVLTYTVIKRTRKFITIEGSRLDRATRVWVDTGVAGAEFALPLGASSQAVLKATNPV